MIVVTGGAGFIGSNIVKSLNDKGQQNIIIVDDLSNGRKVLNISDLDIVDYIDLNDFRKLIESDKLAKDINAIIHQGADSTTTNWDGLSMMNSNYNYSKLLLHYSLKNTIKFIYASSASVYGSGTNFSESRENEKPINMYAYSKFQFDQYVRQNVLSKKSSESNVVGLRYFNVYGPREEHKSSMASTVLHFYNQILETGKAKLFSGNDGYADGEQKRDFIYVKDVAEVNLWFLENNISGIFNTGTGKSATFKDIAEAVINWCKANDIDSSYEFIKFPDHLVGSYQSFTEADISLLRGVGYKKDFYSIKDGVTDYLTTIHKG